MKGKDNYVVKKSQNHGTKRQKYEIKSKFWNKTEILRIKSKIELKCDKNWNFKIKWDGNNEMLFGLKNCSDSALWECIQIQFPYSCLGNFRSSLTDCRPGVRHSLVLGGLLHQQGELPHEVTAELVLLRSSRHHGQPDGLGHAGHGVEVADGHPGGEVQPGRAGWKRESE